MKFTLVDKVIERSESRIVTLKLVSSAEEYLADHFPTFPVLPGVMMLEAMVQAARELVGERGDGPPMVLGTVRALKYGRFVPPGSALRVEVARKDTAEEGVIEFKGEATIEEEGRQHTAAAGRFTLRPARIVVGSGQG